MESLHFLRWMYTAAQKTFRARDEAEVLESIRLTGQRYGDQVRRVFLADGDALVLPTRRLLSILHAIRTHMPAVRRISSYCLPRNLRKKSQAEIDELAAAGLKMVYVGAESGDDQVLAAVKKGETFETTREALDKLGAAGITRSVMILNGLGGKIYSSQHAENSARLANATQPEYLATLVVSFPTGEQRFRADFPGWEPLGQPELFCEMEQFLSRLELKRTVFRSDHASNWLILKGTLGADKERLLNQVRQAIASPGQAPLRPAWARGL
ncbi:radical SAM protein [Dechloromonas denitrificans]|uniref:radical SAM protein n=1 Tax=Dechloromonas denitrificans TaxID=281362 RepID=UPI001CFB7004|nr:radical SAM protein [Dechloromonas denitrificans]